MSGVLRCAVIDCRSFDVTDYDRISSELSEGRKAFVESFSSFSDRMMGAVAGLCMEGLARSLGTDVTKDGRGKPVFGRDDMHLSVSHSAGIVAVVWSDAPVGVDVQEVVPMGNIIDRILTPRERAEHTDMSDTDMTMVWAMKESYVKMTGEGMSRGFDTFDDTILDPGYVFHTLYVEDGIVLSICGSDTIPEIVRVSDPEGVRSVGQAL